VIDVMTRLKVHHMADGGTPQAVIAAKCGISLRSVERVLAEPEPTAEEVAADERANHRGPGRPRIVDDALMERIRVLVKEEPAIAATEVHRRARGWGYGAADAGDGAPGRHHRQGGGSRTRAAPDDRSEIPTDRQGCATTPADRSEITTDRRRCATTPADRSEIPTDRGGCAVTPADRSEILTDRPAGEPTGSRAGSRERPHALGPPMRRPPSLAPRSAPSGAPRRGDARHVQARPLPCSSRATVTADGTVPVVHAPSIRGTSRPRGGAIGFAGGAAAGRALEF
jgi:hypothetical protein